MGRNLFADDAPAKGGRNLFADEPAADPAPQAFGLKSVGPGRTPFLQSEAASPEMQTIARDGAADSGTATFTHIEPPEPDPSAALDLSIGQNKAGMDTLAAEQYGPGAAGAPEPDKVDRLPNPADDTDIARRAGELLDNVGAGFNELRANLKRNAAIGRLEDIEAPVNDQSIGMAFGASVDPSLQAEQADIDPVEAQKKAGDAARLISEANALSKRAGQVKQSKNTQRFLSADTFGDAWDAFKADPVNTILDVGARSAAGSLAALGTGVAGGVVAGPAGFAAGMGLGSAQIDYASGIVEGLQREGVDVSDPDALQQAVADKGLMGRVRKKAGIHAASIGAFDAAAGAVAPLRLAPKALGPKLGEAMNVVAQTGSQAALGAGGEAVGQAASGQEIKPGQIAAEAAGEAVTAPVDVATAALQLRGKVNTPAERIVNGQGTPEDAEAMIDAGDADVSPDGQIDLTDQGETKLKATPAADTALMKLSRRDKLTDADFVALKDAGYAQDNTGDGPAPIEMTQAGTDRFNVMRREQTGAPPDATQPGDTIQPESQDEQEAGNGNGSEPGHAQLGEEQGQQAQAPQQLGAGRRAEQRAGNGLGPEAAQQPLDADSEGVDTGAFDPTQALADSLEADAAGRAPVDEAADTAAESPTNDRPAPTDGQKAAGNYKKGRTRVAGLDIAIENPDGSTRSGTDPDGTPWESKMRGHYGYVRGTQGNDGDAVDVFVKPGTRDANTAYVIDQHDKAGRFDEHKTVLGADSIEDARQTYRANYPNGWDGDKTVTAMPIDQFKDWLANGDLTRPAAPERKAPPKSLRRADREARQQADNSDQPKPGTEPEARPAVTDATPAWRQPRTAFYRDPDNAGIDHEQAVRDALASGNRVPADVMIDYPELAEARAPGQPENEPAGPAQPAPADGRQAAPGARGQAAGTRRQVSAGQGRKVDVDGDFVEAADLVASNTARGNANPNYPEALQPRDRSRQSSQAQIDSIARNIDPELLDDTAKASDGAPIIGPDNVVESGNGRTAAIRRAYEDGNAEPYRQFVQRKAEAAGVDVSRMAQPIYVRRRSTDMDDTQRAEFARQANQSDLSGFSPTEQARSDAARISDDDLAYFEPGADGNVLASSNDAFLRRFADRIGEEEAGAMRTSDGRWNRRMAERVQSAVFSKAYGDDRLLSLAAEEADPDVRNVLAGLQSAAPTFARARGADGLGDLDTGRTLVDAVDKVRESRRRGQDLGELLRQEDAFSASDPDVANVAQMIDGNIRSGKRLGAYFREIGALTEKYRREGAESMFGDAVTRSDIINAAGQTTDERNAQGQADRQAPQTAEPAVPGDARASDGQGQRGREQRAQTDRAPDAPQKSLTRADGTRRRLGADVGDIITPSGRVGWAQANESYEVEGIDRSGDARVRNTQTGSRVKWRRADLIRAEGEGVQFQKSPAPPPDTAENQAPDEPGQAPGFSLDAQQAETLPSESAPEAFADLLGDDTRQSQAVADEARQRDEQRSPDTDVPADVDGGLFANLSRDIEDDAPRLSRASRDPEIEAARELREMAPVELLPGELSGLTGKRMRNAARRIYRERLQGATVTTRDGREVRFTGVGIRKMQSHSGDPMTLRVVPDLDRLMSRAVPLWSEANRRDREQDSSVIAFHNYGIKITDSGRQAYLRLVVRENQNGDILYDNDLSTIEEIGDSDVEAHPLTESGAASEADNKKLSRWMARVNAKASQQGSPRMSRAGRPQIETEAFARWFGDSKVVDDNGQPLVVYHGSPDARNIFGDQPGFTTMKKAISGSDPQESYFFTNDQAVAKTYADDSRAFDYQNAQNAILKSYLSIQNPKVIDAKGQSWGQRGGPRGQSEQIDEAKAEGHDGLIIRNTLDTYNVRGNARANVYIAFKPTQIKSAETTPVRDLYDGSEIPGSGPNRGTFDPNDPDIRASRDGTESYTPTEKQPPEPTEQEAADVQTLQRALRQYLGRDDIDLRPAAGVSSDAASTARGLAPLFGKRVAFFETNDPDAKYFNGLALPGQDVVYLNANASTSHTALLGHELTHYLKKERPDLWAPLEAEAEATLQNQPEYRDWLNRQMAGEGYTASDELVREEMIADAVGDQFLKPSFWQRVMERAEPGVGQRIATMLRNFMDRVIEWLGQRGFGSSRYVGDMQRFRDAAADAFAGYADADVAAAQDGGQMAASRNRQYGESRDQPQSRGLQLPEEAAGRGPNEVSADASIGSSDAAEPGENGQKAGSTPGRFNAPESGDGPGVPLAGYRALGQEQVTPEQALSDAQGMMGLDGQVPVVRRTDMPAATPMRLNATTGAIEVNGNLPLRRHDAASFMVEELAHGLDVLPTGNSIAASSPRLRPGGDLWAEASAARDADPVINEFLSYPMDSSEYPGMSTARRSAELFARLHVLYSGNRESFRRSFPNAWRLSDGITRALQASASGLQRNVRGNRSADNAVSDWNRQNTTGNRSDGAGGRNWRADSRLEPARQFIARELGGSRLGRNVPPDAPLASRSTAAPGSLRRADREARASVNAGPLLASRDRRASMDATSVVSNARDRLFGQRPPTGKDQPFFQENARIRDQDAGLWQQAGRIVRRQFTPQGLLPDDAFAAKIKRDSQFGAVEFDVQHLVGSFEREVKKDYGKRWSKLPDKDRRVLNEGLSGQISDSIPDRTKASLVAMRRYIDRLSSEYLKVLSGQVDQMLQTPAESAGVETAALREAMDSAEDPVAAARQVLFDGYLAQGVDPTTADQQAYAESGAVIDALAKASTMQTIRGNLGQYVHRSYRAFDDARWNKKLDDATIQAARDSVRARYREQGETEAEAARLTEVTLNEILKNGTAYDNFEQFIAESKLGAKDLSVLKQRKEIAPEIRALLGEYIDPRVNFAKSATKMGRLVWNDRFLQQIRDRGMGVFLFEGTDRPAQATTQIAGDGSKAYSPLNGLWTYPEVAQSFEDAMGEGGTDNPLLRFIIRLNGAVKFGKTVLAPTTAARNWQSAMFFALANGHFDMRHMRKSFSGLREYFSQQGSGAKLAYLRKLQELGVVYDTPYAGEMMRLLDDARAEKDLLRTSSEMSIKRVLGYAQKFYQYGDDFWKIIGFENEKRMLMDRAGLSLEAAEIEAAERIRSTYPTYSMVPRAVNSLRKFPLAGTFVSFPAEIIRTSANILRYTHNDLRTPERRSIGMRRAAGSAVFAGAAFYGIQSLSKALLGIDDEEEEAVRQMAAPWNKNSNILFLGRNDKGELQYFDLSFLDPYNYFKRPLNAMMRDEPWQDQAQSALSELVTPFFGVDITAGAVGAALYNQKPGTGTPIYEESASAPQKAAQIGTYLLDQLQPGITSNLFKTARALQGQYKTSGQKYNINDEMLAWVGWRKSTLDPKVALYYKSFSFGDELSDAQHDFYQALRGPNEVSDDQLRSLYAATLEKRRRAFDRMHNLVVSAKRAGLEERRVWNVLSSSGVSKDNIAALLNGDTPPWYPTNAARRYALDKAYAIYDRETADRIADRYDRIYSLRPPSSEE